MINTTQIQFIKGISDDIQAVGAEIHTHMHTQKQQKHTDTKKVNMGVNTVIDAIIRLYYTRNKCSPTGDCF